MRMTATQREIAMTGLATAWAEGYDVTELNSSQRLAARWNAALWKEALGEGAANE